VVKAANDKDSAIANGSILAMLGVMAAVTAPELDKLVDACRRLPIRAWVYEQHDYITNLLLTVLDLQMQSAIVERSIRHYWDYRQEQISELHQLEDLLTNSADDQEGTKRHPSPHSAGSAASCRIRWDQLRLRHQCGRL